MSNNKQYPFKFKLTTLAIPLYLVLFLWIILWLDFKYRLHLANYGIYPRTIKGLIGIVTSPFIHKSIGHLANNSVPLFVMLFSLLYFYRTIAFKIIWQGVLISGFLTWLFARSAYHIGASGVIYLLVSFIFFSGIISKHYRLVAVSLIVVFLYGSLVWYMFPANVKEGISWEGHLFGFITGFLLAIKYRKILPEPEKYAWEEETYIPDDFDKLFDADGNFNQPEDNVKNKDN